MPELPEATVLAGQIDKVLRGRTIRGVTVKQPKCLNCPPDDLTSGLLGKAFGPTLARGKWILVSLTADERPSGLTLALNLGMGGEVLYHEAGAAPPEKWTVRLDLADGDAVYINFWWFGHVHLLAAADAGGHVTAELGPSPLELSATGFRELARRSPASGIKSFLLNQRKLAGIGNVYVQDPLWLAGIHPLRKIRNLSDAEIDALYQAIDQVLGTSIEKGASAWEQDLHGKKGGYSADHFKVAYREGEACPRCAAVVEKIKTGATSSYICPTCQKVG